MFNVSGFFDDGKDRNNFSFLLTFSLANGRKKSMHLFNIFVIDYNFLRKNIRAHKIFFFSFFKVPPNFFF
jgi:hypothetical protein